MSRGNRVFLVDYQAISPLGISNEEIFRSIEKQRLCGSVLTSLPAGSQLATIGAEVTTPLTDYYTQDSEVIREMCSFNRKMELAVSCYNILEKRIAALYEACPPEYRAVAFGWGIDIVNINKLPKGMQQNRSIIEILLKHNKRLGKINTMFNPNDIAAMVLAQKGQLFGWQKTILTACASSSQAIGTAFDSIRSGDIHMAFAGGSDSLFDPISFSGFSKLGIIASRCDDPQKSCKPFDLNRRGTLLGEGAGLLVLASEELVEKASITPKLEILGYGTSLDGYKITAPNPTGSGIKQAIMGALNDASITPNAVDYVNMHGTGTIANDEVELSVVSDIFKENDGSILASSTKDRHGHQIATAGVREFIITAMAMEHSLVPCTTNMKKPLTAKGVDLVQGENRKQSLDICLSNSFAFGGVNSVLVMGKVK